MTALISIHIELLCLGKKCLKKKDVMNALLKNLTGYLEVAIMDF